MGTDDRRYDIQRWELMAGDTIHRDGIDVWRYDIQKWEVMVVDTIYRDGT